MISVGSFLLMLVTLFMLSTSLRVSCFELAPLVSTVWEELMKNQNSNVLSSVMSPNVVQMLLKMLSFVVQLFRMAFA